MGPLVRYSLLLLPETLLLAAALWLAVWAGWLQPFMAMTALGVLLLAAAVLYRPTRRLLQPGSPVGIKALVGRESTLVHAAAPVGRVRLDGELWFARSACGTPLPAETRVRVVDAERLHLIVEPLPHRAHD